MPHYTPHIPIHSRIHTEGTMALTWSVLVYFWFVVWQFNQNCMHGNLFVLISVAPSSQPIRPSTFSIPCLHMSKYSIYAAAPTKWAPKNVKA